MTEKLYQIPLILAYSPHLPLQFKKVYSVFLLHVQPRQPSGSKNEW